MTEKEFRLPHCIGQYHRHEVACTGNSFSENEAEKTPCYFAARCRAFKKHLKQSDKTVADYCDGGATPPAADGTVTFYSVARMGGEKFVMLCDALIKVSKPGRKAKPKKGKRGRKRGRPPADGRKKGPTELAKKAATKALRVKKAERVAKLLLMFNQFKIDLEAEMDGQRFVPEGKAALPGQLYHIDRMRKSGYMSVYCKTDKKDVPLVSLKVKTAVMGFDAKLPITVDTFEETLSMKSYTILEPFKEVIDGKFKTQLVNLKVEQLSLLAGIIAGFAKSGIIELPLARDDV
jgi:hypothetical protein